MGVNYVANATKKVVLDNSPAILTGLGIGGMITTAYLASKATAKTVRVIDKIESEEGTAGSRKERFKERVKAGWKFYIPTVISGAITTTAIVGSNRVSAKRTAAAYSLLAISETAFGEYKDKLVKTIGEKKTQTIKDEINQDRITKNPPPKDIVIGSGPVICLEAYTGRYFMCDMETIRRAINDVNHKFLNSDYVTLNYFYTKVKLPHTQLSGDVGWDAYNPMEVEFTSGLTDEGKPCLVFEYVNLKPMH